MRLGLLRIDFDRDFLCVRRIGDRRIGDRERRLGGDRKRRPIGDLWYKIK